MIDLERWQLTSRKEVQFAEHVVVAESAGDLDVVIDREMDVLTCAVGKHEGVFASRTLLQSGKVDRRRTVIQERETDDIALPAGFVKK